MYVNELCDGLKFYLFWIGDANVLIIDVSYF